MFSFETLIYGCLMFNVPLYCCQNLTLPNVPTRRLLPGNPMTAASATVWDLNGRRQGHELWPQSDGYIFCCGWSHTCNGSWELGIELQWSLSEVITPWWRIDYTFADDFLRLFDTSFQKNVKSHVFLKSEQNEKYVFSNNGNNLLQQHANGTERLLTAVNLELQVDSEPPFQSTPTHSISGRFCSISALLSVCAHAQQSAGGIQHPGGSVITSISYHTAGYNMIH